MTSRLCTAAALSLLAVVAWKSPSDSTPKRYRIDLKTTQVIDLTALGQTEQRQSFNSAAFVAVTLQDTTGGRTITITLDSLKPDSASPIPAEAIKAAYGTVWHGIVGSNGRISGIKASDNPVAAQMTPLLREFLPPVPAGTPAGKAWTDTTENTDDVSNGSMAVRTVTNFQSSSEDFSGTKAVRIASASSSSYSGTQQTGGGTAAIEGTGTGTGAWFIGPDGIFLGGSRNSQQNLTVSGAFAPEPLPVTVTLVSATTLLK
jgi:hypothetical protein